MWLLGPLLYSYLLSLFLNKYRDCFTVEAVTGLDRQQQESSEVTGSQRTITDVETH